MVKCSRCQLHPRAVGKFLGGLKRLPVMPMLRKSSLTGHYSLARAGTLQCVFSPITPTMTFDVSPRSCRCPISRDDANQGLKDIHRRIFLSAAPERRVDRQIVHLTRDHQMLVERLSSPMDSVAQSPPASRQRVRRPMSLEQIPWSAPALPPTPEVANLPPCSRNSLADK